jgi:hypothetical protein
MYLTKFEVILMAIENVFTEFLSVFLLLMLEKGRMDLKLDRTTVEQGSFLLYVPCVLTQLSIL